jgi:hypothetical protein
MSRYGSISSAAANGQQLRIQSADPTDLQTRLNAALTALASGTLITEISLVGAGDGHTFVATVTYAASADPSNVAQALIKTTASSVQVRAWVAGDATQFGVQRALALTGVTGLLFDEMVAGGSQGTRLMGLAVIETDTGLLAPFGIMEGTLMGTALALGASTLLFDMPAVGRLRYRSSVSATFLVTAEITLEQAVTFTGKIDVVTAPSGVPVAQGAGTNYTLVANQKGYASTSAIVALALGTELGIQVTIGGGGSGTLDTARVVATPIQFQ